LSAAAMLLLLAAALSTSTGMARVAVLLAFCLLMAAFVVHRRLRGDMLRRIENVRGPSGA